MDILPGPIALCRTGGVLLHAAFYSRTGPSVFEQPTTHVLIARRQQRQAGGLTHYVARRTILITIELAQADLEFLYTGTIAAPPHQAVNSIHTELGRHLITKLPSEPSFWCCANMTASPHCFCGASGGAGGGGLVLGTDGSGHPVPR